MLHKDGRTEGWTEVSVTISLRNFVGEGIKICDPSVSSTNKTDHHDITEILLKVALNTLTISPSFEPVL
jgi:hypothetical protein